MHTPVFLKEVIKGLNVVPGGRYIDGTYGEGGHTRAIVARGGKVLAIELDEEKVEPGQDAEPGRSITLVHGNYADIEKIAKKNDFFPVDGVLLDFGLSMEQIARSGRGFSYKNLDEPLDMRIDVSSTNITAADIITSSNRQQLYEILSSNSEEISAQSISNALKSAGRVKTVGDVVKVIKEEMRRGWGGRESRRRRGDEEGMGSAHVLRRVFQALRIEVNHEFENIQKGMEGVYEVTKPGGRIVIISFHSLEDRIIKLWSRKRKLSELNKVSKGEKSFEKSAVMRVLEK